MLSLFLQTTTSAHYYYNNIGSHSIRRFIEANETVTISINDNRGSIFVHSPHLFNFKLSVNSLNYSNFNMGKGISLMGPFTLEITATINTHLNADVFVSPDCDHIYYTNSTYLHLSLDINTDSTDTYCILDASTHVHKIRYQTNVPYYNRNVTIYRENNSLLNFKTQPPQLYYISLKDLNDDSYFKIQVKSRAKTNYTNVLETNSVSNGVSYFRLPDSDSIDGPIQNNPPPQKEIGYEDLGLTVILTEAANFGSVYALIFIVFCAIYRCYKCCSKRAQNRADNEAIPPVVAQPQQNVNRYPIPVQLQQYAYVYPQNGNLNQPVYYYVVPAHHLEA
ncbi:hypothetical protein TVAG_384360 [Trichomonas vaginalis G3]|uniref:Uncharacterized protein n=1 Tax=Trichomonas vaginalis (strain ATCC PRA-98 / G3) TaxID=412133 RepID=A2FTP0_TRIV3|nr:hypothetical protein TVAGG3_0611600 [Trichomonas vaginalis G3]EAX91712.1 hypothetical protein TVAG_384360 [Trichomonas vaginalis G3]KAI5524614.1 hypothetical protein TVAGG3_0611600 [Trichomonas vaginalis G3]|eukprot:XP_001304642.1 hypothetical protein [Trichomonas vaginalis G3]